MAQTATNKALDWDLLRQEGLAYLQEMSGHIWTDFNVHDPGVTILETLCYAITDLGGRLSLDIEDLRAQDPENGAGRQFFSPAETLTTNPVTVNDYRKLLIDLDGVKNAWLVRAIDADPSLYYDKDNNALLYDFAKGSERVTTRGLYRVYIEKEESVNDEAWLLHEVEKRLHEHRNIGEDFIEVNIMQQETISVFTDIQINEDADATMVMAKVYFDLENFISPRIRQYTLKRMLQKGKTIEQIFNGPQLENGFIDDDELGAGDKRNELHTSDLIRIIMAHAEVRDVRNLFLANKPDAEISGKKEWALVVDDTKALLLEEFNSTKIHLFKNETICPINATEVLNKVDILRKQRDKEMFDNSAMDFEETLGDYTDLAAYSPMTHMLPATYGVSEAGLASTASDQRKAQAMQLRAYMLFFEQVLVNYFKQLASFRNLFAFRQDREKLLQNYFSQELPAELWQDDFPEIAGAYVYQEKSLADGQSQTEIAFNRKNRLLSHLLAQFNEKFADYALFGYKYNNTISINAEDKPFYFLRAKADYLEKYPELSRDRNRACNYMAATPEQQQLSGLKELISAKLGLDNHIDDVDLKVEKDNFHIVEHILLRPDGFVALDFICSEKIAEQLQPDPYSYTLTYILPQRVERFNNSKFKELVYAVLENETPAHISYRVLELNPDEMTEFVETYAHFLLALKNIKQSGAGSYNPYRNKLIDLLGIGQVKLPVLHLDACNVDGDDNPQNEPVAGAEIGAWKDLSRNNNDALPTLDAKVYYAMEHEQPFLLFENDGQLQLDHSLVKDDFSIAVVFKAATTVTDDDMLFNIISNADLVSPHFSLAFNCKGEIEAEVNDASIVIESTLDVAHIAIFTRDIATRELNLYIDGVLRGSACLDALQNLAISQQVIEIGPDMDETSCLIGEIIILDSVISGAKREKLEQYFAEKWSIPLSAVGSIKKPLVFIDAVNGESVIREETTAKVSRWNDLSEHDSDIIQNTAALQPVYVEDGIYNTPAVRFNNSSLSIPDPAGAPLITGDFSLALLFQADVANETVLQATVYGSATDTFFVAIEKKGELCVSIESAAVEKIELSADMQQPHIAIITCDATSNKISIHLDGKSHVIHDLVNAGIFSGLENWRLGGYDAPGNPFSGYIGEMILFDSVLSAWDRQRLEAFWAKKWKIDITGVDSVIAPVLHLDASRLATVLSNSTALVNSAIPGDRVDCWLDLSPAANNAVQADNYRKPEYALTGINNLGAINFSQTGIDSNDNYIDSLSITRTIKDDFTVMVVFKPDPGFYLGPLSDLVSDVGYETQWTAGAALVDADCSGFYNDFGLSIGKDGDKLVVMAGIGDRLIQDHTIKSGKLTFDAAHMISFSRLKSTGEVKLSVDGLLYAEADLADNVMLNDARKVKIGAFNSEGKPFRGYIGEVIMLDSVIDDAQRKSIEYYLSVKWDIALSSLPVDNTGLALHLDAANKARLSLGEDRAVTEWHDVNQMSDVVAIQNAAELQPLYVPESINKQPGIRFNNSYMKIEQGFGAENVTLVLVYKAQSSGNCLPGSDAGIIQSYTDPDNNNLKLCTTRDNKLAVTSDNETTIAADSPLLTPRIVVLTRSYASAINELKLYIDGLQLASQTIANTALAQGLVVGALCPRSGNIASDGYFHGDIAELALFNRVVDLEERQVIENYLAMKWKIDISGIKNIVKPVAHFDASRMATVIYDTGNKVVQWSDVNGSVTTATQADSSKQPLYRQDAYNGLGVIQFANSCLTFPRVVSDDFAIIAVYKTDADIATINFMPVPVNAFTAIAHITEDISLAIWNNLKPETPTKIDFIDSMGNILPAFTPNAPGFTLGLNISMTEYDTAKNQILNDMIAIVAEKYANVLPLKQTAFAAIDGINEELSETIWYELLGNGVVDANRNVLRAMVAADLDIESLLESMIINVLLAENWFEGVGLVDSNCPGDSNNVYKRDFGLLINKQQKLVAGIGVPGERDYKIEAASQFDELHIGIFSRKKDTGIVKLYVDNEAPVQSRFGINVKLNDSETMTIGAVNTGGNYFKGDIAEIIILDVVPEESDLLEIRTYLCRKWGI